MDRLRDALRLTLLLLLSAGTAAAQAPLDDEPAPRAAVAPTPVPDATLQALRSRTIAVQQRSGGCLVGELIGFDAATVTLALAPSRDIVTIARVDVAGLRLADAVTATTSAAAAPPLAFAPAVGTAAPTRDRHFGLQLGLAPALMLDYEAGLFYGFINADVVLPMASGGDLLAFGAGAGVSFPVASGSRWRLDIFAHLTPARFGSDSWSVGGGVGLGVHYTARNGFTLGFKAPILGYSGYVTGSHSNSSGDNVAFYYLDGVMGLPVISLGYRF